VFHCGRIGAVVLRVSDGDDCRLARGFTAERGSILIHFKKCSVKQFITCKLEFS
jgi:hypothetical protein